MTIKRVMAIQTKIMELRERWISRLIQVDLNPDLKLKIRVFRKRVSAMIYNHGARVTMTF